MCVLTGECKNFVVARIGSRQELRVFGVRIFYEKVSGRDEVSGDGIF